ncbi:MAG TPA: hypothetical protein VJC13_01660 [Candidatus Paceibacterota bacterium]
MDQFLIEARRLMYSEVEKTGIPAKAQVDLAVEKGIELAKRLNVNVDIIEASTLLMDCMVGQAVKAKRLNDHVSMSLEKAKELLNQSSLSIKEKDNIYHCILEHHGVEKFYSLESEICCNADCYKFASMRGFVIALRYTRDMPLKDLVALLTQKVEEKWSIVSLQSVKDDLKDQYQMVTKILHNLSLEI